MNKRDQTKPTRPAANTQQDPKRWRVYGLVFFCALTLVSGFFFAGRQHFSSMDYGMKNSRLRKQVDELEAEKRRLLLSRAVTLSPAEIKRAAKKVGLTAMAQDEPAVAQIASTTKEKAATTPEKAATASTSAEPVRSMIIKTASVSAVHPVASDALQRNEKAGKQTRKTLSTE